MFDIIYNKFSKLFHIKIVNCLVSSKSEILQMLCLPHLCWEVDYTFTIVNISSPQVPMAELDTGEYFRLVIYYNFLIITINRSRNLFII